MQKIDKSKILAEKYIIELELHKKENDNIHPKYSNSAFNRKHYTSVYMNLLGCQKGVCAYTEALITNEDYLSTQYWKDGKYIGGVPTKELDGDIEHFNPDLKEKKGWEWSNLFIVIGYVNKKIKKQKKVNPIFKPDNSTYNPFDFMTYNFDTQRFVPLPKLEYENKELFEDVKYMILTLGLNSETIKNRRQKMLLRMKKDIENNVKTINYIKENELEEFFTAFEMSQNILNS